MSLFNLSINDLYLLIFGLFLLWNNLEALFEFKKIRKGLQTIEVRDIIQLSKWRLFMLRIVGVFIFKWLIYLIAIAITENLFVIIVSIILGGLRLYISYFSLEKIQESRRLDFIVLMGELLFVIVFMGYYFGFNVS
ncbi:hypothetical protein [Priestia megaterium]|uniref:hypothetical protein n=1 Tax=Priestia megaterium TaxID=1404 RepID=UPI000BF344DA|nr:hypothetical protein [Priestia megaterium]PER67557.1 hypothetical protein CN492_25165 [Priestia megaterium]